MATNLHSTAAALQLDLYSQPLSRSRLPSLINAVGRRLAARGLRM